MSSFMRFPICAAYCTLSSEKPDSKRFSGIEKVHRNSIKITVGLCEDKTIEMFLRFRCLDLNTRRGAEDINYLVEYPPGFILLNLNLRNHSELSIVILRLLNFILNFCS